MTIYKGNKTCPQTFKEMFKQMTINVHLTVNEAIKR